MTAHTRRSARPRAVAERYPPGGHIVARYGCRECDRSCRGAGEFDDVGNPLALILGFGLSAVLQAVVRKSTIVGLLGDDRPRTLAVAAGLGAASSSCSYAAVALARSLFRKGANFTAAMAALSGRDHRSGRGDRVVCLLERQRAAGRGAV